jgi:MoaA/NifB/PqqE/SkfB family radical SAM enzyme
MKQLFKKALIKVPAVQRYVAEKNRLKVALAEADTKLRTTAADWMLRDWNSAATFQSLLIERISAGLDLNSTGTKALAFATEHAISDPACDPVAVHRDIGQAIFERDPALYAGEGLPDFLRRFTYPAFLSTHLNENCNATCFFCRDEDFKGWSLDFDKLHKIDSALRMARVIELTGWGEPFSYPRLPEVIDKCLSLNSSPNLFSFTTNGSILSARWGHKLSGKLHRLCISINAATPDTYAAQMRYKNKRFTFDYVVGRIRDFVSVLAEWDRSKLALHMVANTDNFREMPALIELAADLRIPSVTIGNYMCANESFRDKTLLRVREEYNEVLAASVTIANSHNIALHARKFFTAEVTTRAQDTCLAPFERLYAEVPGDITPCCFMGAHRMGNIYESGVEAVWFSDQMQKLRRKRYLPACQICTLYNPFDDEISHLSPYLADKEKLAAGHRSRSVRLEV